MNKELSVLVDRLKRIFPHLQMRNEGHHLNVDEYNYCPPFGWDWYEIIKELDKNGLEIKNKK